MDQIKFHIEQYGIDVIADIYSVALEYFKGNKMQLVFDSREMGTLSKIALMLQRNTHDDWWTKSNDEQHQSKSKEGILFVMLSGRAENFDHWFSLLVNSDMNYFKSNDGHSRFVLKSAIDVLVRHEKYFQAARLTEACKNIFINHHFWFQIFKLPQVLFDPCMGHVEIRGLCQPFYNMVKEGIFLKSFGKYLKNHESSYDSVRMVLIWAYPFFQKEDPKQFKDFLTDNLTVRYRDLMQEQFC